MRAKIFSFLIVIGIVSLMSFLFGGVDSSRRDDENGENLSNSKAYMAAVSLAVSAPKVKYQVSSSTPQFVILSFDGSKSVTMLNETLAFQQKMQAENKPLYFTYFINATYFLTKENAKLYQAPKQVPGISNIGFSDSASDIALRVAGFNRAFATGNEIGSHLAGHFNGATWSYNEWQKEFNSFAWLLANVQKNNPLQKIESPNFLTEIKGFRAPNLGVNDSLYQVLGDRHFLYDTSGIGSMTAWPKKDAGGVWRIPLGTIFVGPNKHPLVAMDYNLWQYQSDAGEWNKNYSEVESAYLNYFKTNYYGNRAPVVIGHHFTKWNDGVYWEALKAFAENVCGLPQVRCATFQDLVAYLDTTGVPPTIK